MKQLRCALCNRLLGDRDFDAICATCGITNEYWKEYHYRLGKFEYAVEKYALSVYSANAKKELQDARRRLDKAVCAFAAAVTDIDDGWLPVDPEDLPDEQWMLVTDNLSARDANGEMTHVFLTRKLWRNPSTDKVFAYLEGTNIQIFDITHWRPLFAPKKD